MEDIDCLAAKRRHMRKYWASCRHKMVGFEEAKRQFYHPHKVDDFGQRSKHEHRPSCRTYSGHNLDDHIIESKFEFGQPKTMQERYPWKRDMQEEYFNALDLKLELAIERAFAEARRKQKEWEQEEKSKPQNDGYKELQPSIIAKDDGNKTLSEQSVVAEQHEESQRKEGEIEIPYLVSEVASTSLTPLTLGYELNLPFPVPTCLVPTYDSIPVVPTIIPTLVPIAINSVTLVKVSIGSIPKDLIKQYKGVDTWNNSSCVNSRINQEMPRKGWIQPQLKIPTRWMPQFKFRRRWIQQQQLKVRVQFNRVTLGVPKLQSIGPKEDKILSWIAKEYEDHADLRTNPFQEEGNDVARESTFQDPFKVPVGQVKDPVKLLVRHNMKIN